MPQPRRQGGSGTCATRERLMPRSIGAYPACNTDTCGSHAVRNGKRGQRIRGCFASHAPRASSAIQKEYVCCLLSLSHSSPAKADRDCSLSCTHADYSFIEHCINARKKGGGKHDQDGDRGRIKSVKSTTTQGGPQAGSQNRADPVTVRGKYQHSRSQVQT